MGGIGSGGGNRKSREELKRLGTFRKDRHENRIGDVLELPIPQRPTYPPPAHLGSQGKREWNHLWLHVTGLTERDLPLVQACAEGADQVQSAYIAYLEQLKTDALPQNKGNPLYRPQSPALARALAAFRKELRADRALLGLSAKDRAASGAAPARPRDALLQLRRPGRGA